MNATMNNGTAQRKQLSSQLDRLDNILDGLAEALNESVADAVRGVVGEVVREAVSATVREVLGNADLPRTARPTDPPPGQPARRWPLNDTGSGALPRLIAAARSARQQLSRVARALWTLSLRRTRQALSWGSNARAAAAGFCQRGAKVLGQLWRFRTAAAAAVVVGAVVGVSSYLAGPAFSGVVCGLSGAVMTVAAMIVWPLCRLALGKAA